MLTPCKKPSRSTGAADGGGGRRRGEGLSCFEKQAYDLNI
jgi:hypothetical protein